MIGIIYESRPNVTSDAAVLCLKSGNATILRGGSEAIHSNRAIAAALQEGGETAGLPEGAIQLIPFTDRASVQVMAGMDKYLDLIIPRGGKGLNETVVSMARMPVIKHYDGICHVFVDAAADLAICRAGAASCAELTLCRLPAVLIPLPTAAHDHQRANAVGMLMTGGADMIEQVDLTVLALRQYVEEACLHPTRLVQKREALEKMGGGDAAGMMCELIEEVAA